MWCFHHILSLSLSLKYLLIKRTFMKESINELKSEFKAKLLFWKNIQSMKVRIALLFLFLALIALKLFTTILTFDWIAGLFN
jgi:hypothetical protein